VKFDQFEVFWRDPEMMNPTPEITGSKGVDNIIYILWEAATIITKGAIAPPVPASGGPAAEAQAVVTKSLYRQYLAEELEGFRRLVAHQFQNEQQKLAVRYLADGAEVVEALRQEVDQHRARNKEKAGVLAVKEMLERSQMEGVAKMVKETLAEGGE